MSKSSERLNRLFVKLESRIPNFAADWLTRVRRPQARLIRIPLGILLVFGGIFSFLPVGSLYCASVSWLSRIS